MSLIDSRTTRVLFTVLLFTLVLGFLYVAHYTLIAFLFAVFFAYHVLWPAGLSGRFEWPAAVIGIAAAVALIRFKVGVIPVVFISGLCGLALSFAPYLVTG